MSSNQIEKLNSETVQTNSVTAISLTNLMEPSICSLFYSNIRCLYFSSILHELGSVCFSRGWKIVKYPPWCNITWIKKKHFRKKWAETQSLHPMKFLRILYLTALKLENQSVDCQNSNQEKCVALFRFGETVTTHKQQYKSSWNEWKLGVLQNS